MTVLHRLFVSGSDRAAERWMRCQAIAGTEELSLHHLYRAMGFLGEPLSAQTATPVNANKTNAQVKSKAGDKLSAAYALRTRKDLIEEELFARRRDLFTDVELVFFDTTSIYFEGEGGQSGPARGTARIIGRTSSRWWWAWCWTTQATRCAARCGRATRAT